MKIPPFRCVLSPADKQSQTWLTLKDAYEARLQLYREMNDADHDPEQTAKLRGKIAEVKELLRLHEAPPPPSEGAR